MAALLRITMVRMADGERLPMLIRRDSGIPVFSPTVHCISVLRARNLATATIGHALRGIAILLEWAQRRGVDLEGRVRSGTFLTLGELDDLVREMRSTVQHRQANNRVAGALRDVACVAPRDSRLERLRMPVGQGKAEEINRRFADSLVRYARLL